MQPRQVWSLVRRQQARPRPSSTRRSSRFQPGAALSLHRGCVPYYYPLTHRVGDEDIRFAYAIKLAKEKARPESILLYCIRSLVI